MEYRILTTGAVFLTVVVLLVIFNEYYKEKHINPGQPKYLSTNDEDLKKYIKSRNLVLKLLPRLKDNTYKTNFHVLVDNVIKGCDTAYKVIVLVSSHAPHYERRRNIRNLWANKTNWNNNMWKVIFVAGGSKDPQVMKNVYHEAETYKDVIMEDIPEDFYNMAKKVMIGLQWAHVNFKYDYILKCDDDVFVDMDQLTDQLKEYTQNTYFGQLMAGQPVLRSGRYGVTKEEHEADTYDPYCSGGGFVLSHYTVETIIPFFNWEHPLKIDDAYMGQLVYKTGVKATHNEGFHMWNDNCEFKNILLLTHPVKKRDCMEFLQKRSMIKNGKLKDKKLEAKKSQY